MIEYPAEFDVYDTKEWFESLSWQHRWIEAMVGWWVGEFGLPQSVCDFGAGDGWWPYTFKQLGSKDCYAVELHDLAREYIPDCVYFTQRDLRQPFSDGGKFDLAICLEVAEHLPKPDASTLCQTLAAHTGDLLLFSAAGSDQPGTGHINLQVPEYWRNQIERQGKVVFSASKTGKAQSAFKNILPESFTYLAKNVQVFARV